MDHTHADTSGSSGSDASSSSSSMMMHGMKAYFHFTPGDALFFETIVPSSSGAVVGACVFLFFLAILDRWFRASARGIQHRFVSRSERIQIEYADNDSKACLPITTAPISSSSKFILSHELSRGAIAGVFPAFQAIDVFGPLDALNMLSLNVPLNLAIIAATSDPVSTKPISAAMNRFNSKFSESIVPTHTFDNAPDLDVLIIPGGLGTRAPDLNTTIDFITETYPSLDYLITVCTGSWLAARAGILDNRNATSNKRSWSSTYGLGNNTTWVSHARWVTDGNVWSSSGVSAGIDVTFAFIGEVYGAEMAETIANGMEYERHLDASWDPFADLYNATTHHTT